MYFQSRKAPRRVKFTRGENCCGWWLIGGGPGILLNGHRVYTEAEPKAAGMPVVTAAGEASELRDTELNTQT